MARTVKSTSPRPTVPVARAVGAAAQPAVNLEDRLWRIEVLGKQIESYVHFMCQAGSPNGTSPEAKEHAVTAFLDRLIIVEGQLRQIHDEFRLA